MMVELAVSPKLSEGRVSAMEERTKGFRDGEKGGMMVVENNELAELGAAGYAEKTRGITRTAANETRSRDDPGAI